MSPRALDPGNYRGEGGAQFYFGVLGAFLCPLVSMLNHILNKGVIIVHVEEKFPENLENPLVYGIFRSQAEKMKNFENVFF